MKTVKIYFNGYPSWYKFLKQKRGDDFDGIKFQIFDKAKVAIDITGADVKMMLKKTPSSDVALAFYTSDEGITVQNTNEIVINERDGADMNIAEFDYMYDLQVTFPDGKVKTMVRGIFPVEDDITR